MSNDGITINVIDLSATATLKAAPAAVDRAVLRAGSDGVRAMRTEATRRVRERKSFKLQAVRKLITIPSSQRVGGATGKTVERLWRLKIAHEFMPMFALSPRQTKRGVVVQVNKGKRITLSHAFIARMKSGHRGVFVRYGEASRSPTQHGKGHARYRGQKRQPIRELFTSRVQDPILDSGATEQILHRGGEVFRATYERNIRAELNGARGVQR
jgi:hypothetical protein